jgi:hypothetical protein
MVRYGTDAPTKTAFARDLSERGMQIQTNSVLAPGTTIQLELKFPDRVFTLWARVAWAKRVPAALAYTLHCGMGLEFLEPGPEWTEYYNESRAADS